MLRDKSKYAIYQLSTELTFIMNENELQVLGKQRCSKVVKRKKDEKDHPFNFDKNQVWYILWHCAIAWEFHH